ncbi:E3 ubiquitin-protein ligase RBBP6 isoform 2-T2 [Spinachia spinachia]
MTHVHYKFSSKLSYDTVVFDGPHVTLRDLKRQIMGREKLRAGDCDLQITNAQSKEEYKDDECSIPKGSSVIVRRVPVIGSKASSSKTRHVERSDGQTHQAFGAYRAMEDQSSSRALPLFSKMANLADVDGSEEDKIKVMINQSTYDAMNYNKKFGTVLPANYTCYRCGNTGHHIRNCPVSGDKNFDAPARIKKSTGIPRSFMVEVDDPNTKGAMLTNCGRYAIPSIDIAAYAIGKKERPPFVPQEQSKSEEEEEPVPEELLCGICHDLMSDAVVIPCCGNSYCDDCIRSALLDSEDHVCPTCGQLNVSPDTLIANKYLRQTVETFTKERGCNKSLARGCGTSQSQDPTPTASPVPTPSPIGVPSQPQKPHLSTQQDPLRSQAADTLPPPQVCAALPAATSPASSPTPPSTNLQPEPIQPEEPDREAEEKINYKSAAAPSAPVTPEAPTDAPSQPIPLVNLTPPAEQPQVADVEQRPSGPAPKCSAPLTCWESSSSSPPLCPTGGWSESSTQQLRPSFSPYPATPPPPLFPPPHFHTFLAAQQPLSGYPPGYPSPTPLWTLPNLQGTPIPSLCPSPAIPALIPKEWYRHQTKKERSPRRESSSRRSSSRSDPKSSKFKPSHLYSRSSSRSRSRSHGRSRPSSPYSRHKDRHSRSRTSYSFGYKRSPTPSSSSSPRGGYHSRPKSPADSHHSRHHGKKSALGGSSSRRREEHNERQAEAPGGSLPGHLYAQHANPSGGLDRKRYLQWSREYKEWCDKYFSSYVGHFHQLPLPLLNIPPPPQWEDGEGSVNRSRAHSDPRSQRRSRRDARTKGRSPPSRSSSDSRSPPSRSSRDSRSTLSQSSSDSHSSPSRSSNGSLSSPSRSSSDRRSTPSKGGVQPRAYAQKDPGGEDAKRKDVRNLETLGTLKHEQKKKHEEGGEEESSSLDAADSADDCREDKRRHGARPKAFRGEATTGDALEPVRPLAKPERRLDKEYERRRRGHRDVEMEKGRRRGKHSDSRQDVRRRLKETDTRRADRHPGGCTGSDSRSHRSRKRKGEDTKRSSLRVENSKCQKTNTAEDTKSESPNPFDQKTPKAEQKKEGKAWLLTQRDVWEGGISVKPQKKISININLEGKREEKTEKQQFSYFKNTREEIKQAAQKQKSNAEANEKESSREVEVLSEEKVQPNEGEARQKWEKATFRDDKGETLSVEETTEQSQPLWDERDRMGASKGGEVRSERSVRGAEAGQATGEGAGGENRENLPGESKDAPMEEWRMWEDEEDQYTGRSKSHRSISEIHQDAAKPPGEGSSGHRDPREEEEEVKALEECGKDRAADQEDELIKVTCSEWDKEEPEEDERAEGAAKAQTEAASSVFPSSSVRVTSQDTADRERGDEEEKRERSGEAERGREIQKTPVCSSSHRSSRDRKDRTLPSDRDRERRRDRDRGREGERPGGGQRESRRSTERAKDDERGRDRERERKHASVASAQKRNPPSSSSRSRSRDTERGVWQRGGAPGDDKSSPRPGRKFLAGRSRQSGAMSRAGELPDQNPHRSCRDTSDRPPDRPSPPAPPRSRSRGRDPPPCGSEPRTIDTGSLQNRGGDEEPREPRRVQKEPGAARAGGGGGRREGRGSDGRARSQAARELEEGERPSSHGSSASQEKGEEDGRDESRAQGKKHKKEKRPGGPEPPPASSDKPLKTTSQRGGDGREERSGGGGDGLGSLASP